MQRVHWVLFCVAAMALASCGGKKGPDNGKGKTPPKELHALSDFTPVETCSPTLEWNAVQIPDAPIVSYDIAVYKGDISKKKWVSKEKRVYYKEAAPLSSMSLVPPLEADTPYFWSIRVRQPDGKVSQWSTNSKTVKRPAPLGEYKNHWHFFVTPESCHY